MEMYQVFVVLSLQWRLWSTNNTKWLVKRCCIACILCTSNILIAQEVSNVAKEVGCSTAQVALNWIRQQNMLLTQKNKIIQIIGSRKESEIKDNLVVWSLYYQMTKCKD